jgi:hypothetical protein
MQKGCSAPIKLHTIMHWISPSYSKSPSSKQKKSVFVTRGREALEKAEISYNWILGYKGKYQICIQI